MSSDRHEVFQHMIDQTLAGVIPEQEALREHLQSCAQCQQYLSASTRAIAGLGGFSFEVDPNLHAKVCASISLRAQQLQATHPGRRQLALVCVLAFVLTATGSYIDLQFGGLVASVLDIHHMQVRQGLIAFWIVPSLLFLLLFPILPLVSANRKGRVL
jgi:hypothetical protein